MSARHGWHLRIWNESDFTIIEIMFFQAYNEYSDEAEQMLLQRSFAMRQQLKSRFFHCEQKHDC